MKLIASLFKRFKPRRREESLDFLRGIAVFFMLLAHAIFFFYQGENNILRNAKLIGDTFCFTVFLFVSGTVTYLAYLRQNENASLFHQRLWRRSLIILGSYYIVALVSVVKEFAWPPSISWWQILGEVLIFIKIPGFIEFLIPLILYRLLYFPLKNFYKFVLKDWKRVALASAIIYGLGSILYSLEVSPSLISWKALIVGESNWYTFPLLQYFPIFLIGLYWGKWISATKKSLVEEERAWFVGFYLSLGFALMLISAWAVGIHPGITLNRWPPSPLFLTLGLALVFLLIALDFLLEKLQTRRLWMRLLFFWGKYAF
ncbi:DUF1624 domain-containing protein, partial [Patescibacteria group bacterium]|nr:DUF1624 domain-containing protein [Patescibacteria group bacterium]